MSNIVENWLFTLSNNNSGFVRLAFSDVTYSNNFYHGAILNRPTISESINLDQSTSTTSSITLEVAEFQYSSLKMSQELYGGTNSYINQQIQVDLLVNGSATTVGKFRINDISYDGFKITIRWLAELLSVSQRTIYRHLCEDLRKEKETLNEKFWKPIIEDTDFKDYITKKYSIVNGNINLSKMDQH